MFHHQSSFYQKYFLLAMNSTIDFKFLHLTISVFRLMWRNNYWHSEANGYRGNKKSAKSC